MPVARARNIACMYVARARNIACMYKAYTVAGYILVCGRFCGSSSCSTLECGRCCG